jgi:RNA polymerase sigma-70 factor (ECF subfamily)
MTLRDEKLDGLLRQAREGDEFAFASLVARLREQIVRWALVITADSDDAEDVAQQVSMTLHRKLRDFEGRSLLTSWLYTIVRNQSLNLVRRRTGRRETELDEETPSPISGDVDAQLTRLDNQRSAAVVRSFFRDLPPRQRELIELIDTEGYTVPEAAEFMGIEQDTARVHLLRARRTIRSRMLETQKDWP